MAFEDGQGVARGVPQPRRVIITGRQDAPAIRAEHRRVDWTDVVCEYRQGIARGVPQPRCIIITSCQNALTIRAEHRRVDPTAVAFQGG